jgi:CRP/FNR family cyclic AMP-dependent transcriptional regulator
LKEDSSPRSRTELEAAVTAHPFFAGMRAEEIRLLADCALAIQFEPGQLIFSAGDMANRFYLIESGRVILETAETDRSIVVDEIGPGDLLGWSWIFPPYRWHFASRAIEPTRAIFFYGTMLREYCEADPALGYELFKRMSEVMMKRLQRARTRLIAALAPNK